MLKRLALENAAGEAEASLQFCVELRENAAVDYNVRLDAAKEVMNRVWGHSRQQMQVNVTVASERIAKGMARAARAV